MCVCVCIFMTSSDDTFDMASEDKKGKQFRTFFLLTYRLFECQEWVFVVGTCVQWENIFLRKIGDYDA